MSDTTDARSRLRLAMLKITGRINSPAMESPVAISSRRALGPLASLSDLAALQAAERSRTLAVSGRPS